MPVLEGRRTIQTPGGRVTLSNGRTRERGISLSIDGTCQSYIDLDDPTYMHLAYVRSMSKIIDELLASNPSPNVLHIGGGALTMPRRLSTLIPGSRHLVLEPNEQMLDLLFEIAPLPNDARINVEYSYGENGITRVGSDSTDLIVLDAFVGQVTPETLRTPAFFADAHRVLRPGGSMIINVIEHGEGLPNSKELVALADGLFTSSVIHGSSRMLTGNARNGNVTVLCTK